MTDRVQVKKRFYLGFSENIAHILDSQIASNTTISIKKFVLLKIES